MAVQLYKKGDTHTIRGILCTMQNVDEYSFEHLLKRGWYLHPEDIPDENEKLIYQAMTEDAEPAEKPVSKPVPKKKKKGQAEKDEFKPIVKKRFNYVAHKSRYNQ